MRILVILLFFSLSACAWIEDVSKSYGRAPAVAENASIDRNNDSQWLCYGEDKRQDWRCRVGRNGELPPSSKANMKQSEEPLPYVPEAVEEEIIADIVEKNTESVEAEQVSGDMKQSATSIQAQEKLTEIDGSYFAVQLYAGITARSGLAFIKSQELKNPRLLSISSRWESWHVVLLGVYATKAEAQRKADEYNRIRGGEKPWVRSVKGLKNVLLKELDINASK